MNKKKNLSNNKKSYFCTDKSFKQMYSTTSVIQKDTIA